jgi:hypothetical protein
MDAPGDVCYVSAGALLISERLVGDQESLREALERSGMPKARLKPVMRTLSPLIASMNLPNDSIGSSASVPPARGIRRLFKGW